MKIITLTSDLGFSDYYLASLKGYIHKRCEAVNVIDVSNTVKPFDIVRAAYFVNNCIADFPDGTVHILAVKPEPTIDINNPERGEYPCVMQYKNQFFVGIDNGIFSLILKEDKPQAIYKIEDVLSSPTAMLFAAKNILAKIACDIVQGVDLEALGSQIFEVKTVYASNPIFEENQIRGSVLHIDHYGNIISNISKDLFHQVGKGEPFVIYFRAKEYYIDTISATYSDVPSGEKVAFFNIEGNLEIAINNGAENGSGGAESLIGMKVGDMIRIEFHPQGSKKTIDNLFS